MKRAMEPVHPGSILREDVLKEMDVSITKAAAWLEISRKQLSKIVNESASISVEMALRLEQAFGVKAEFWLDLQKKYDIWKIEKSGYLAHKTVCQKRTSSPSDIIVTIVKNYLTQFLKL